MVKRKIAFICNAFCIRGTEANLLAYAHYNMSILNNESIIIVRKLQWPENDPDHRDIKEYFNLQFKDKVYHLSDDEIDEFLIKLSIDACMVACPGNETDFCPLTVPTISHCVFQPDAKKATVVTAISDTVANGSCPVLPNILRIDRDIKKGSRDELGIPEDAIVFGRYGGYNEFDISFVHRAIKACAEKNPKTHYFLFMNTAPFLNEEEQWMFQNIIFLPGTPNITSKTKFIMSCDAMIHGRSHGESFGMACGEFAICECPIITTRIGYSSHIDDYLKDNAILYTNEHDLEDILTNFDPVVEKTKMKDHGYYAATGENVILKFAEIVELAIYKYNRAFSK